MFEKVGLSFYTFEVEILFWKRVWIGILDDDLAGSLNDETGVFLKSDWQTVESPRPSSAHRLSLSSRFLSDVLFGA